MKRRTFLGAVIATAGASLMTPAVAKLSGGKAAFVLVHGSWHGAWCFGQLSPYLSAAGHMVVAKDLPGHGLLAKFPPSYQKRPLDLAAFASDVSPVKDITLDDYVGSIVATIDELTAKGSGPVILLGHSMGGIPITAVGEKIPQKIKKLVYLTAFMLPNGTSGGEFIGMPEGADAKVPPLFRAAPPKVGALRIDPRSDDPAYQATLKAAFYADVPDDVVAMAANFVTPDDPASVFAAKMTTTKERWGRVKRAYIKCEKDYAIRPLVQQKLIDLADAFTPSNRTEVLSMDTSHSPFLSAPEALSKLLVKLAA